MSNDSGTEGLTGLIHCLLVEHINEEEDKSRCAL